MDVPLKRAQRLRLTVQDTFIIALNRVDLLSLAGLAMALYSFPLMLAGRFDLSVAFLLAATSIDFMDGAFARKYGLCRDFGRYLDGFIDVVTYLVAPSLLVYLRGFDTWYYMTTLAIFVGSGIVRLSVFNQIGNTKTTSGTLAYLGMPVFWSTFALAALQALTWYTDTLVLFPVYAFFLLMFSFFMQYRANFYKFQDWRLVSGFLTLAAMVFAFRPLS